MQFTQFSDDNNTNYFLSQAHQPFLLLAFVNALLSMLIFMLSYKNILNLSISTESFHIYGFIYLFFTPAFLAFLFIQFTTTSLIHKENYMPVFNFYYLGSVLFILGSIVSPVLSSIGMLLVFTGHLKGILILKKVYNDTDIKDRSTISWILLSMQIGLISHIVFIIGELFYTPFIGLSMEIAIYLYLFLLSLLLVHQRLQRHIRFLKIIFFLLVLHIMFEGIWTNSSFIVDALIVYLIGKELLSWKLPFQTPDPFQFIFHIALYWVPIGFALTALTNFIMLVSDISFLSLDMHTLTLGFVLTMIIGLATRVTIEYSENSMHVDLWIKGFFLWTQIVVSMRILVSFIASFGWDFMFLFDLSAIVWLIMFIAWGSRFFLVLIYGKKLN